VQCRQFYVNSSTETVQGIAGQERTALWDEMTVVIVYVVLEGLYVT
jgi:hypothetical protein